MNNFFKKFLKYIAAFFIISWLVAMTISLNADRINAYVSGDNYKEVEKGMGKKFSALIQAGKREIYAKEFIDIPWEEICINSPTVITNYFSLDFYLNLTYLLDFGPLPRIVIKTKDSRKKKYTFIFGRYGISGPNRINYSENSLSYDHHGFCSKDKELRIVLKDTKSKYIKFEAVPLEKNETLNSIRGIKTLNSIRGIK